MTRPRTQIAKQMMGAAVGLLVDRALGEPPQMVHPVANFGKLMGKLELYLWQDNPVSGFWYATFGLVIASITSLVVDSPFIGTALGTYIAVAERSLLEHAFSVKASLDNGAVDDARRDLPALVGRDVLDLNEFEIARAVVESVAENSSDAVVAPMLYAAILGSRGALAYRAINTMDAMVGHKSSTYLRFGRISARLDDFANLMPSRVAAVLTWLTPNGRFPHPGLIFCDAKRHPSPNAGVIESTYAHKLHVTLGGENSYFGRQEIREPMGQGRKPSSRDIWEAACLCRRVDTMLAALLLGAGFALYLLGCVDERP